MTLFQITLLLCLTALSVLRAAEDHHDHDTAPAETAKSTHGTSGDSHAGHGHDDPGHGGHENHEGHEEGVVHLAPAALKAAALEIVAAGPRELVRSIEVPGELGFNEDRVAHVVPRTAGLVAEVNKSAGDRVKAGEQMAVIQSPEMGNAKIAYFAALVNRGLADKELARETDLHKHIQTLTQLLDKNLEAAELRAQVKNLPIGETKAGLVAANASYWQAQAAAARAEALKKDGLITTAEYELARLEAESADARLAGLREEALYRATINLQQAERGHRLAVLELQNAERRLHILGLTDADVVVLEKEKDEAVARLEIVAPFAGTVLERHLAPGEQVTEQEPVFVVADLSNLWCTLRLHAQDLGRVHADLPVTIAIPGQSEPLTGAIAQVAPTIDERTRAGSVRVVLDNTDGRLRPGQFVTARIGLDHQPAAVAVPVEALQTVEGQTVVFVPSADGDEFKATPVQVGFRDRDWAEIKAGLEAGTKVVGHNSFLLKAEMGKGEGGHDH